MTWRALLGILFCMAAGCGAETAKGPAPTGVDSSAPGAAPTQAAPTAPQAVNTAVPASNTAAQAAAVETASASPDVDTTKDAKDIKDAKPSAPATITAALRPGAADISIVFGSDGTNVVIKVWGVDGLKVTKGATPTTLAAVKSGLSTKMAVQFDAPTSESNLAVSVSGTFGGREQTKVQSFTVNAGAPKASPPAGASTTDKEGRPVKVMKAK